MGGTVQFTDKNSRSRGCSSVAEHQLPKLNTRVRFSSPARIREWPLQEGSFAYDSATENREEHHLVMRRISSPARIREWPLSQGSFAYR